MGSAVREECAKRGGFGRRRYKTSMEASANAHQIDKFIFITRCRFADVYPLSS
jgi:hypothetical protein